MSLPSDGSDREEELCTVPNTQNMFSEQKMEGLTSFVCSSEDTNSLFVPPFPHLKVPKNTFEFLDSVHDSTASLVQKNNVFTGDVNTESCFDLSSVGFDESISNLFHNTEPGIPETAESAVDSSQELSNDLPQGSQEPRTSSRTRSSKKYERDVERLIRENNVPTYDFKVVTLDELRSVVSTVPAPVPPRSSVPFIEDCILDTPRMTIQVVSKKKTRKKTQLDILDEEVAKRRTTVLDHPPPPVDSSENEDYSEDSSDIVDFSEEPSEESTKNDNPYSKFIDYAADVVSNDECSSEEEWNEPETREAHENDSLELLEPESPSGHEVFRRSRAITVEQELDELERMRLEYSEPYAKNKHSLSSVLDSETQERATIVIPEIDESELEKYFNIGQEVKLKIRDLESVFK